MPKLTCSAKATGQEAVRSATGNPHRTSTDKLCPLTTPTHVGHQQAEFKRKAKKLREDRERRSRLKEGGEKNA